MDDNLTNLKVFVNLLKCTKVDVADSGRACLEMITTKNYDLIFLDHMMPEMDGIETLHNMKKLSDNKCIHTPIVALIANTITGAKEMYLREGFDAFLPKFDTEDVYIPITSMDDESEMDVTAILTYLETQQTAMVEMDIEKLSVFVINMDNEQAFTIIQKIAKELN